MLEEALRRIAEVMLDFLEPLVEMALMLAGALRHIRPDPTVIRDIEVEEAVMLEGALRHRQHEMLLQAALS